MSPSHKLLRWTVWWLLLVGLTCALLSPQAPEVSAALLRPRDAFVVSKTVHVFSYGFLAALAGWLPARMPTLAGLWLFLMAHGVATECLQEFVPGRFGSWRDVVLDTTGVVLGSLLVTLYRRRRRPEPLADPARDATTTATGPPPAPPG